MKTLDDYCSDILAYIFVDNFSVLALIIVFSMAVSLVFGLIALFKFVI